MSLEGGGSHSGDDSTPSTGGHGGEGTGGAGPSGGGGGLDGGGPSGGVDGGSSGGADGGSSGGGLDGGSGSSGGGDGGSGVEGGGPGGGEGPSGGGSELGGSGPGGAELGGPGPGGGLDEGSRTGAAAFDGSDLAKAGQENDNETDDNPAPANDATPDRAQAFGGSQLEQSAPGGEFGRQGQQSAPETRGSATPFGLEGGKAGEDKAGGEVGRPGQQTAPETRGGAKAFGFEGSKPGPVPEVNPDKQSEMNFEKPSAFGPLKPEVTAGDKTPEVSTAKPAEVTPFGFDRQPGTEQPNKPGVEQPKAPGVEQPGKPGQEKPNEITPAKQDPETPKTPAKETPAKPGPERVQPQTPEQPAETEPAKPAEPEKETDAPKAPPVIVAESGDKTPDGGSKETPGKTEPPAEGPKPGEKQPPADGPKPGETEQPAETPEQRAERLREAAERHAEQANRQLDEALEQTYKDDPEKQAKLQELASRMREATKPYYDESVKVAQNAKAIETYSDHNKAHIPEVTTAAVKNAEQLHKMEDEKGLPPEARVKDEVLVAGALWHDVGMAGAKQDREALAKDPDAKLDGNTIRKEHSNNSALEILRNQDKFDDPAQALETAVVVKWHSKSNSGVPSLGDKTAMVESINKLQDDHQKENPNEKPLDLSVFGKVNKDGRLEDLDPSVQTRLTNEALALRVADAQRPASDAPTTMTGRVMEGESVKYEKGDTSGFDTPLEDEVLGNKVEFVDPNNPEAPPITKDDPVTLKFVNGENNVDAGTVTVTDKDTVEVTYVVKDAYVDQAATRAILNERMQEADSAPAAKDAAPGSVNREQVVHVVQIEKGDEAARAALEAALNKDASYHTKNGEPVTRTIRVELKS